MKKIFLALLTFFLVPEIAYAQLFVPPNAQNFKGVLCTEKGGTCATSLGPTLTNTGSVLNTTVPADREVTAATDTILATDFGKTIVYKNRTGTEVTIPAASSAGFTTGFSNILSNWAGDPSGYLVVTPTSGLIDNVASLKIGPQHTDCVFRSNGTNWVTRNCPVYGYNPVFSTAIPMTALDSRITISNASTSGCSYIGSDGNIHFTAVGSCGGRIDYNPSTRTYRGIKFETAHTNLVPKSQITSSTAPYEWASNSGATRAAQVLRGQTGTRVTFAASAASGYYSANNHTQETGKTYTVSALLKYISGDGTVKFGLDSLRYGSGGAYKANITVGTADGSYIAGDAGINSYTIEPWGDNTYRVSFNATYNYASNGTVNLIFYHGTAAAVGVVDVYNIQVVEGTLPGSFIPTSGTAVAQAADIITVPTPYWLNSSQGTLCATYTLDKNVSGGKMFTNIAGDRSALNFFSATNAGSVDGTNTVDYALAFPSAGTATKACVAYGGVTSNVALNGVAGTARTFDGDYNLADLTLFNGLDGVLNAFEFSTYKFTDAQLVAGSTP